MASARGVTPLLASSPKADLRIYAPTSQCGQFIRLTHRGKIFSDSRGNALINFILAAEKVVESS